MTERRRTRGVVATGDSQSAEAGAQALSAGGNAVDAAVAAAFAAFICEASLCSPLGGAVLLVGRGDDHFAMDCFARTPGLGLTERPPLDFSDVVIDFGAATQVFHVGRGSAAVPLALSGLIEAQQRWGKLPLSVVAEPAVTLGRHGFALSERVAYTFSLLEPIVKRSAQCREIFFDGDRMARGGAVLYNKRLADALEQITSRPEKLLDLFGQLAHEFGPSAGGLITHNDVTAARVAYRQPLCVKLSDWSLYTMPSPSSGGVLISLGARLLSGVGRETGFLSVAHLERLLGVQRVLAELRMADFDERCRDPVFVQELLRDENVAALRERMTIEPSDEGENPLGSTTHVSVLDELGGSASLTFSNGEGSGYVLSGTGMHVNNLLGEQDLHPRGFHRDPAGIALCTMMAPTVLTRKSNNDRIALGSGGSNRLRNAILSVVCHIIEHRIEPQQAVSAPRLHLERHAGAGAASWLLAVERPSLTDEAILRLTELVPGPALFDELNMFFGGVHVARQYQDRFDGAGDPRRGGAVCIVD
jgi:gamma-glutamyltranspeptidase/glutathione hydrolase